MTRKRLYRALALCLALSLCLGMTACFSGGKTDPTTGANMTYTVQVKTEGGLTLEKIGVYVYEDSTLADLVAVEKTDETGTVSFDAPQSDSYVAVLKDVPEGYGVEESYPITGATTEIVLKVQMVEADLNNATYTLGGAMGDFTFTAADGKAYKLSELLQTKKAVVLNFWYLNCAPCKMEFPFLQEAYAQYSDSIEVLAMNPVDGDDASIQAFAQELGLTFPIGKCDSAWEKAMQLAAYPTTVVIDRFGSIAMIHKGSVPETKVFTDVFAFFTAEDYVQTVVEDIEDILTEELATGTPDNPTEIGGVTQFELEIKANQEHYVNLYKVKDAWLQIKSSDVYVKYNNKTYEPSGGKVGLVVNAPDTYTPAKLVFGNKTDKDLTITVNLSSLPGTMNNPYDLELGEFQASVSAGNDQGVYYTFTAPEDGLLTLQCLWASAGINYDFTLYNLDSYAMRVASAEGNTENGIPSVSMPAKKGQTVQFSVGTLPDSSNTYPAGSFTFKAEFKEGAIEEEEEVETMTYAVTVTDSSRNPIANVQINLQIEENKTQAIKTNSKGIAGIKLPAGTYPATLVLPIGYTASTTQFTLTEQHPIVSIKMDTVVVEIQEYTVLVNDENGKPMEGVMVAMGGSYATTNAEGIATFQLPVADYTVSVVAPEGYAAEAEYAFEPGQAYLTIQLKPSDGSDDDDANKQTYTVTVTDYQNNPQTGVLVQVYKSGAMVAMQTVNDQGVATMKLEKGSYTVELAFPEGVELYYESRTATLTSSVPNLTIRVAPAVEGTYEEVEGSAAYVVTVGGTYVKLPNAVNYFLFTPEEAGVYEVTTSNKDAQIQYWGSTFFPANHTPDGGFENNTFVANVKPSGLGAEYLLAVAGNPSECILIITRTGDAILDESDLTPEPYEAKTPPTPFTYTGSGTLTYVDLTASHKAVYNAADGYYHLDSASGPVLYMNLGPNAPFVSMYNMLGFTGVGGTGFYEVQYNAEGAAVRKEDYVPCMSQYIECIDSKLGIYPVTEDLMYMMQHGGAYRGWWDSTNPNYLFTELPGVVADTAWMFSCCYFE